jgi:hypothetical protein
MATIPSIAMIPSGYKASKVYSVLPNDGAGDLTFSRAGALPSYNATRVNSDGLIEEVLSNVPRLDYSDGGCPSLLIEPQSINLLTYSEDFSNVSWTKINSTITTNAISAPDGTLTADKLVLNMGINPLITDATGLSKIIVVTSGVYNYSIFAKSGERNIIRWRDGGFSGNYLVVDLSNGTFTNGEPTRFVNPQVIAYPNGWYRISFTTGTITNLNVYPLRFGDTGQTGDGISGGFIWGAQLEALPYATSYIPTVASTVTRVAETASKTGLSSYINSSEGVLYFEGKFLNEKLTTTSCFSITNGTSDNLIQFFIQSGLTNTIKIYLELGNTIIFSSSNILTSSISDYFKIAIKYKSSGSSVYFNGLNVLNSTTTYSSSVLDRIIFGQFNSTFPFYGKVKNLQVYPTALSDAQLIALTTL